MNSPVTRIGGKKLLRKQICERFPKAGTFDRYIEVFGGAGWVLFYKGRHAPPEVYNDADGQLVNLMCIKISFGADGKTYGCNAKNLANAVKYLSDVQQRLLQTSVVIEHKDLENLIKFYDRTSALFYCDPPYHSTEKYYDVQFGEADHIRLHDTLSGIKGKFMLSYNDDNFVRELYRDFKIEAVERGNNLAGG